MTVDVLPFDDLALIVSGGADLSDDGVYRWQLTRTWDYAEPVLAWIMLNPSTADAEKDDRTIGRCVSFARGWGYGGILVVNLFAARCTDPKKLPQFADPVGRGNDERLLDVALRHVTVAAWGASVPHYWRHRPAGVVAQIRAAGGELFHLGLTADGHPRHPLYVKGGTPLTRWAS